MKRMSFWLLMVLVATTFWNCSSDTSTDPNSDTPNEPTIPGMSYVKSGTFQMGSTTGYSDEQPVHSVTLSSYYLGKYEVTQAEWLATMGSNPAHYTNNLQNPVETVSLYSILVYCNKRSMAEGLTPCYTINSSTDPAIWGSVPTNSNNAAWDVANCNWNANGYRLPTEAEWEYAARGGVKSNGYIYSGSNNLDAVGWFIDNSNSTTHPVGLKAANELGLYDMSGNVWEWAWDKLADYTANAQTNPTGGTTGTYRIIRGGGLGGYNGDESRTTARSSHYATYPMMDLGFRVARSVGNSSTAVLNTNHSALDFGTVVMQQTSAEQSLVVSGSGLTENVIVTPPAEDYEVKAGSNSTWTSLPIILTPSNGVVSTTILVRFKPLVAQVCNASIVCKSGALTKTVSVSGIGISNIGSIVVSDNELTFGYVAPNTVSTTQTVTVAGTNLSNILTLSAPTGFEISKNNGSGFASSLSLALTGSNVASTTIYVRFKPTNAQTYSGNITCVSGSVTKTVSVSGIGISNIGSIVVSDNELNFGYVAPNTVSTTQTVTVAGTNLSNTLTLTAPTGFEISKNSGSGFASSLSLALSGSNVASTTIYVRFKPTAPQAYRDSIRCVSGNTLKLVCVTGTGVPANSAMVLVNGGTFQMGDANIIDAKPVHSVTLNSFYIGKYEVTQADWLATMSSNPSYITGNLNRPVEQVSWYDILVYCNKRSIAEGLTPCYTINGSTNPTTWGSVPTSTNTNWNAVTCNWTAKGYRLPTEAEWEFAARGGNSSHGYTYSGSNTIGEVAWYLSNSGNKTHAVGTKAPNELGIYDMSGNVWEWNWDWYGSYSSTAQTNPYGATTGSNRVDRGGSSYNNDNSSCVAYRSSYGPYNENDGVGFRLARSL